MDIGVHGAGFRTVCAIESDPHCAATLRRNGARKVVWQADVRVVDPQRLLDVLGLKAGELGLLHGGPPCQPFSQIGKQAGMGDPRGVLIFEVLRFARVMRPAAVLIEQVPYFLRTQTATGRHLVEELRDEFRALGYDMHLDVLDAQVHGVAQRRRRALFVCLPACRYAVRLSAAHRQRGHGRQGARRAANASHRGPAARGGESCGRYPAARPRAHRLRAGRVVAGQGAERAAGHSAQSHAQGHHQVPAFAPARHGFCHCCKWKSIALLLCAFGLTRQANHAATGRGPCVFNFSTSNALAACFRVCFAC